MGTKRFISALVLFSILASCKKDDVGTPPPPGSLKLSQVRTSDSSSAQVSFNTLEYDGQGRLTSIFAKDGNNAQQLLYQIIYPDPTTVLIKEGEAINSAFRTEISIKLDGSGRPASRFERVLVSYDPPLPFTRSVSEETTFFLYGSDGFLERTITRVFDSSYQSPTGFGIRRQSSVDTAYYTTIGGNLAYSLSQGKDTIVRYAPGPLSTITRVKRSREDFDYSRQLALGNYGKNAFLYQDLGYLGIKSKPNYLPYLNIANKSFEKKEILDASGNWVFAASQGAEYDSSTIFTFNEQKLISRIEAKDPVNGITYFVDYSYK